MSSQGDYEAMLLSLPEHQRKQLLEGDWDIKEGAAFTGSYSAVLWFAVSPDEQLILYRELYVSKVLATDLAEMVLELEYEDGNIKYGVLDSSLWHKRGDTGPPFGDHQIEVKVVVWQVKMKYIEDCK